MTDDDYAIENIEPVPSFGGIIVNDRYFYQHHKKFDGELVGVSVTDMKASEAGRTETEYGYRFKDGTAHPHSIIAHNHVGPDPNRWECNVVEQGRDLEFPAIVDAIVQSVGSHEVAVTH